MLKFGANICTDPEQSSSREWLETNGVGGFATSTVSGINTRRYHSLLTAAARPPLGRIRLLSKFEEIVRIGSEEYSLSANRFPGTVHPVGFRLIEAFGLDPFPVWTYAIEETGVEIRKKIFAVHGENTVVCRWEVIPGLRTVEDEVELELRPLLAYVEYHSLRKRSDDVDMSFFATENCVWMRPVDSAPEIFFNHNARSVSKTGDWYLDFEYAIEEERGFDFREDLFQPFSMHFDLHSGPAVAVVSTRQINYTDAGEFEEAETARREGLCEIAGADTELKRRLVVAADQFIVERGEGHTVIAGYPWFSDWGRDTMISLPGLTLATKREGIAKGILREFSKYVSQGMIPNRFPDEGETPEYNTADATLWFIEAGRAYAEHTGDLEFVKKELFPEFRKIVKMHVEGTRFGIRADEDGLLHTGTEGSQLTWMDAKYGDEVFTPRIGKPVEIQALWYNALRTMEEFASKFKSKKKARKYGKMAEAARASFNRKFWNEEAKCLYDVIEGDRADASIRPNQIFAVSLPHSMLSASRAKKVVQKVEQELFTPYGLRSLSPEDPAYRAIYIGSPYERDSAYHQGTVWAWPMGAFIDSLKKVYPKGRKLNQHLDLIFESFLKHTEEAGVGQISEIFDGGAPHRPRGCFAQAWSVAEILRVVMEED
ncbi:MAG: glycogen debranching enzyme family protein [Acidobacteriota bacterium]|nr:MAG: glycogen debranching enzyme family protein [Acidobacteriota bacterium]